MSAPKRLGISIARLVKSRPPAKRLLMGIIISSTRDLIIAVKAPPTATPMARSMTLPRLMNSRNSLMNWLSVMALRGLLGVDGAFFLVFMVIFIVP